MAICDLQLRRLDQAARQAPHALRTESYEALLETDAHLVALAVPLADHFEMAKAALLAGKTRAGRKAAMSNGERG